MSNLIPHVFNDISIRTTEQDGQIWFVANDVCQALNIANPRDAIKKLDDDEKGVALTDTLGGQQQLSIINESGLFILILRCRDAMKKGSLPWRVRKWVTSEVLPSIRKTGSYTAKTTVPQREGLREAVHYLVGKRHLNFNEAYKLVHQRFNVHSIEELPAEQLPQAVQYVHALALDTSLHGEVLDALHPPAAPQGYTLSHGEELALNATFCYLQQSVETNRTLFPILEAMGSKFLPPVYDAAFETGFAIGGLTRLRQHCHQTEVDLRQRLGI